MRPQIVMALLAAGCWHLALPTQNASAQFPYWRNVPVRPNFDLIPPLGNRLPLSYRARYNRPSYYAGKIAYWIEPSSQEAMAWEKSYRAGRYEKKHMPRHEDYYVYPKPWEVLGQGPRRNPNPPADEPNRRNVLEDEEASPSDETTDTADPTKDADPAKEALERKADTPNGDEPKADADAKQADTQAELVPPNPAPADLRGLLAEPKAAPAPPEPALPQLDRPAPATPAINPPN